MRQPHLLGDDWASYRWYATEQERDRVLADMRAKHVHYREGDYPSVVLTKVEE